MELLKRLDELTRTAGKKLLVALLADVPGGLADRLEAEQIVYVNCDNPGFRGRPGLFQVGGDGHPNERQHALWAKCLKDAIDAGAYLD